MNVRVGLGEAAVAVEVEVPLAVAEHADLADAVAVPVAGDRHVARRAVVEHVVDQVGPRSCRCAVRFSMPAAAGGVLGRRRHVLHLAGRLRREVVGVRQARLALRSPTDRAAHAGP